MKLDLIPIDPEDDYGYGAHEVVLNHVIVGYISVPDAIDLARLLNRVFVMVEKINEVSQMMRERQSIFEDLKNKDK